MDSLRTALTSPRLKVRSVLDGLAGQLTLDGGLVEADDPLAPDLDHRHRRLLSLAHDAARRPDRVLCRPP